MKITKAYAFICGCIFCNNICVRQYTRRKVFKQIWLLVPGVIYCIQCIMKGGRFNVIAFIIAMLFYLYFALQYKSNWRYRIELKNLAKVVIAAILIVYLFWFYKEFVGRTSEASLFEYISQYIGGPYELFNQFIQSGSTNAGNETFAGMVTSINKILGTNLKSLIYHEFRFTSTGIMLGNAYSGIRNYYSDFGIIGVILMCFNLSAIFNLIYCRLSKSNTIYKHCFGFILYGSLIYCIIFHFFTDYFFARLSVGWFIEVLIMYICFYMMTKVRFEFGK